MLSDRDKLRKRSPEELRFLRDHIAAIQDDPDVKAALEAHDSCQDVFTLGAFQSGVLIDGFPCRLTYGTLALLRATQARILGYGDKNEPLSDYDVTLGVFLLCDDTRNIAISVADDLDELAHAVRSFRKQLNPNRAAVEIFEFLRRAGDALSLPQGPSEGIADDPFHAPDDSWSDDVDLFAHEYHWSDDYILWELPLIRAVRLKDSIVARRKGERRTANRGETGIALLQSVEKAGEKLNAN